MAGCAAVQQRSAVGSLAAEEIRRIQSEVEALRGLRARRPLDIRLVGEGEFLAALHRQEGRAQGHIPPALEHFLGLDRDEIRRRLRGARDALVGGFYDDQAKVLYVREGAWRERRAAGATLERTLAHEIEHALQDQTFGLPDLSAIGDIDARLAFESLIEGDARAVEVAFVARRSGQSVPEAFAELAQRVRRTSRRDLLAGIGVASHGIPPSQVARMHFPYEAGFLFVERFYRTGGFALVDRLFAHPPISTAQILHPREYLAGLLPIPIDPPTPPPGYEKLASGNRGELGVALDRVDRNDLHGLWDGASGWRGDAFTLARSPADRLAYLAVTRWDSEARAASFEAQLRREAPNPGQVVGRNGSTVMLLTNLSPAEATVELAALPATVHAPLPVQPPLGGLQLVPAVP